MARVSATASLGIKVSLQAVKQFDKFDNTSPHHSITIERQVSDDLTDQQLVDKAKQLHKLAEGIVKDKINEELKILGKPEKQ